MAFAFILFPTIQDFDRSTLAQYNWLDEPVTMDRWHAKKWHDPNAVFKVFSRLDDEEDHQTVKLNKSMLSNITVEFNWYGSIAMIC